MVMVYSCFGEVPAACAADSYTELETCYYTTDMLGRPLQLRAGT